LLLTLVMTAAAPDFATLRQHIVDSYLADNPTSARELGLDAYDGKAMHCSAQAWTVRIARITRERDALQRIDASKLSPDDALDRGILLDQLDRELFELVDLDGCHKHPDSYQALFSVSGYLDVAYAPLPERMAKLVEQEEAALKEAPCVLQNLTL